MVPHADLEAFLKREIVKKSQLNPKVIPSVFLAQNLGCGEPFFVQSFISAEGCAQVGIASRGS